MHKKHLMEIVDRVRPKYYKYKTDEMAKEIGHKVLHLPLYDLNSWAQVKHNVKMIDTCFKIKDMEQLIQQGFDSITADRWKGCVENVTGIEADTWKVNEM
jgi:hypothetical protein